MIGIYKITSPTGRVYIGQSIDIRRRVYKYASLCTEGQIKIDRSLKKYGWDAHTFEVVEECEINRLDDRERYWQEYFDSVEKGLNCYYQGTDDKPRAYCEKWKKSVSERLSGGKHHLKGKKRSEETSAKIRATRSLKKYTHTEETILLLKSIPKDRIIGGLNPRARIVMCTITGIFYDCIKDAAFAIGIPAGTLSSYLQGRAKNKTSIIYA